MSRGVVRGGCEVRQSVSWWVGLCWLFGLRPLQHWSLQAVRWGQILVLKVQPPREFTEINIPWGLRHQCPCPHGEPQWTPFSPEDPPRPTGRPSPGSYELLLCPGSQCMWSLVCTPRVESLFAPALWSSCPQAPLAFKAKYSESSSSQCQAGEPELGLWTLHHLVALSLDVKCLFLVGSSLFC